MADRRDELDSILDEALASYWDAEPLAGLEERIVTRIRATQRRTRAVAAGIVLALSAVMCAVIFGVPTPSHPKLPVKLTAAPRVEAKPLPFRRVDVSASKPTSRRRQIAPKAATFPMRSPVTQEERLLLVMLTQNPGAAAELDRFRQRQNAPLEITPLDIPELPSGSEN
jgi:hypothetical protein